MRRASQPQPVAGQSLWIGRLVQRAPTQVKGNGPVLRMQMNRSVSESSFAVVEIQGREGCADRSLTSQFLVSGSH